MYFALKLHEVSPCACPYPCLEGLVLVLVLILVLEGLVLVLVLGGSVLVNITALLGAKCTFVCKIKSEKTVLETFV